MAIVVWDVETYSQVNLKERGAHNYACDPSSNIFFFCYSTDDSEVQVWKPGDPVPGPFTTPSEHFFITDNWEFERAVHAHILVKRYGFPEIPLENQDCAQRLALANAFPAELGLRCEALGLPYKKDPEARKAMLRLTRPQTAKKRKKSVDPAERERDLALLLQRCMSDVEATRAAYAHPRLRPLLPAERQVLLADARINARGIHANVPFLEAAQAFSIQQRNAINTRINELTAGVITSANQIAKIIEAVNSRGHNMTSLDKRSVAATLAHQPTGFVKELLTLRQRGAFASTTKFKKLLAFSDPQDHRIRGALRIYGGAPGGGPRSGRSCITCRATTPSCHRPWWTRSSPGIAPSSRAGEIRSKSPAGYPARPCARWKGVRFSPVITARLNPGTLRGSPARCGN
jgi:DNA polymerase